MPAKSKAKREPASDTHRLIVLDGPWADEPLAFLTPWTAENARIVAFALAYHCNERGSISVMLDDGRALSMEGLSGSDLADWLGVDLPDTLDVTLGEATGEAGRG
jgi:hypothetical protein